MTAGTRGIFYTTWQKLAQKLQFRIEQHVIGAARDAVPAVMVKYINKGNSRFLQSFAHMLGTKSFAGLACVNKHLTHAQRT